MTRKRNVYYRHWLDRSEGRQTEEADDSGSDTVGTAYYMQQLPFFCNITTAKGNFLQFLTTHCSPFFEYTTHTSFFFTSFPVIVFKWTANRQQAEKKTRPFSLIHLSFTDTTTEKRKHKSCDNIGCSCILYWVRSLSLLFLLTLLRSDSCTEEVVDKKQKGRWKRTKPVDECSCYKSTCLM